MSEGQTALALNAATVFGLDDRLRILGENDPDRTPGPRAFVAGCVEGVLIRLRADVSEAAAEAAADLVGSAPWSDAAVGPTWLGPLVDLLGATAIRPSLIYALDHRQGSDGPDIIRSDTPAGAALIRRLEAEGMPAHLVQAGFAGVRDLWAPWCAVLDDGEIAALAFAARRAAASAEVGVYTFPAWRGRGLAAVATAAWSALPELAAQTLFYSTTLDNLSSQWVTARLGLRQIGAGLRLI